MFLDTTVSSGEDTGIEESLPPVIEKVLEENKDMMLDEMPKTSILGVMWITR